MDEIIDYVMETPGNTNPNVLRGMLNNSGGNLPPVTSDDNGDVLTVVDGKWAKAAPSGGSGVLVVGFDENDMTKLNKTWQQIADAAVSGIVALVDVYDDQTVVDYLGETNINDNEYQVIFKTNSGSYIFIASSASGYPVSQDDNT